MRVMLLGSGVSDLRRPGPALPDAAVLARDHQVQEVAVLGTRDAAEEHRVLVDASSVGADDGPSQLIPAPWAPQLGRSTDEALERLLARPRVDVVVTLDRAMLAAAVQLCDEKVRIVHRETSVEPLGSEALGMFAGRCDAVLADTGCVARLVTAAAGAMRVDLLVVPRAVPEAVRRKPVAGPPTILALQGAGSIDNLELAIRGFATVAAAIPDWRLRVLAPRARHLRLGRLVGELGLGERIDLGAARVGPVAAWGPVDLGLLTSESHHDHPTVALAGAAGVPVVAADWDTGVRDLLHNERDGLLVRPRSVAGLGAALRGLADDSGRRDTLGQAARLASERLAVDTVSAQWADALGRVTGLGRRSSRLTRARDRTAQPVATPEPAEPGGTLGELVGVVSMSDPDWFALPATSDTPLVLVLRSSARRDLLGRLSAEPGLQRTPVSPDPLDREPSRLTTVGELDAVPVSHLGLHLADRVVEVQLWDEIDTEWHAPMDNGFATVVPRASPRSEVEVDGVPLPVVRPFDRPTFRDRPFPVDAVYTWVDGADERWQARRTQRLAGLADPGDVSSDRTASGVARFVSRDELRYSLRSLRRFAPWIQNIYLVTDGQVPAWLRKGGDAVRVVDHAEILPASALPTYNSHAIETALHRIEGLSESFLYFNDDMFLGAEVGPEAFFSVSGAPKVFLSRGLVGVERQDLPAFLQAAINNRALLERDFSLTSTNVLQHVPYPLSRALLTRLEESYPDELRRTADAPFRSPTDLSPTASLAQYVGLATGAAELGEVSHRYVDLGSGLLTRKLRGLARRRDVQTFCLGDAHFYPLGEERVAELVAEFLEEYLPDAAPWETDGP